MKRTLFSSCLVLFLLTQAAFAQSDKAKAKKIDELIGPFAASNQFSGVVLASEDGKVIYEKAFGLANNLSTTVAGVCFHACGHD